MHIPNELEGVFALYWTSSSYVYNDSLYVKHNLQEPYAASWIWIIESSGENYRSYPVQSKKNLPPPGEKEIVPKEVVRHFTFGIPIHNRIFFKNYFSHIYNFQKKIFYYRDSVTLTINRNFPTKLSNTNFALTGTLKDSMYVKVGQKPPGIPKPFIYAWVRVTYNIVCEKYCSIKQWKKNEVDYVVEGDSKVALLT